MHFLVCILASIAVVHTAPYNGHYSFPAATTLVRAPERDSAYVQSERFGNNFAYSIAQRHAYQVLAPQTVTYNPNPYGYYHNFNQLPFGASVPSHHFFIQHPFSTAILPSYVPVVYPGQQPAEYPVEPTEPAVDGEPTENPDAETVVVVGDDADVNSTREETTDENQNESNDTNDDSITVDAYRFGGSDQ